MQQLFLGAKLRVRLLKFTKFLALGNRICSCSDLIDLLIKVSKDKHLLRPDDLNYKDKMNYDAVERLCKPHIRALLAKYVPGS